MFFRPSARVEFASHAAEELLAAHRLVDLDAVFRCGRALPCRHGWYKGIAEVDLRHDGGVVRVFVKRQWKRSRLIPRARDLRLGKAFSSYPLCEWRGLHLFRQIGLDTAEPLAIFRASWSSPRSAVVTKAVPCRASLDDLLRRRALRPMETRRASMLIDAVAATIEQIHGANCGWGSMEAKHFYPAWRDEKGWRIWLIDCETAHRGARRRDVRQQRRKFLRTLREAGADERFLTTLAQRLAPKVSLARKVGPLDSCTANQRAWLR